MAAINFTNIRNVIYDWIYAETGLDVIWEYGNGPQPDINEGKTTGDTFVSLRLGAINKIGQDFMGYPAEDLSTKIIGNREFTLSINVKGNNAVSICEDIRSSLEKPSVLDLLRSVGVVVAEDNAGMQNLTGLDDTIYYERGVLDIVLRTTSEVTDDVDIIESTVLTGTTKDYIDAIVDEREFTIDITP